MKEALLEKEFGRFVPMLSNNGQNVTFTTTPNLFPTLMKIDLEKQNGNNRLLTKSDIEKTWYIVERDNYVWLKPGYSKKDILEQYIKNLDIVNVRAVKDFPYGIRKYVARVASKYNLDLDIIDNFELRMNSKGHAAYNNVTGTMKIVPEYYLRLGTIRIGSVMVPEFEKTFLHEFGHAVWHKILTNEQQELYKSIIPTFYEKSPIGDNKHYTVGVTNTLDGERVAGDLYTDSKLPFVSDYARYNHKEDFSESFAHFNIDPEYLRNLCKKRYDFFQNIFPKVEDKMLLKTQVESKEGMLEVPDYVSVDLQYNEARRNLAISFMEVLSQYLRNNNYVAQNVKSVMLFGDYISKNPIPEDIKGAVVVGGLKDDIIKIQNDNVRIWLCSSQPIADRVIYEARQIGMDMPTDVEKPNVSKILRRKRRKKQKPLTPKEIRIYFMNPDIMTDRKLVISVSNVMGKKYNIKPKRVMDYVRRFLEAPGGRAALVGFLLKYITGIGKVQISNELRKDFRRDPKDLQPRRTLITRTKPLIERMKKIPGIKRVRMVGGIRRHKPLVHDVDILISSDNPTEAIDKLVRLRGMKVIQRGPEQVTLKHRKKELDIRVVNPEKWGSGLLTFTGSVYHNIYLRNRARKKGWFLNRHGLFDRKGKKIAGKTEKEIYQKLGLPYITPRMRYKDFRPKYQAKKYLKVAKKMPKFPLDTLYSLQKHEAERAGLHYDLRIAIDKKAHSFSLPKGMPKVGEKRLALMQPKHSVRYMMFQGEIKKGYGKGRVTLDDFQKVRVNKWGKDNKSFDILKGKHRGSYRLIPYKDKNYLLIKKSGKIS